MQSKALITFQDFPRSSAVEQHIVDKINELEKYYGHITSCDVTLRQEVHFNNHGSIYRSHVTLSVPGAKLNVTQSHADLYIALRDMFKTLARRLKDFARKQRGETKQHPGLMRGIIDRVFPQEGFGFITANNDEYYFDEYSVHNIDFEELRPRMSVDFMPDLNGTGPQAKRVTVPKARQLKTG